MEGRHCTVVRSEVADNSVTVAIRYMASTRSNTGEVYRRGADFDNIKNMASTPAYSVKGYDYYNGSQGQEQHPVFGSVAHEARVCNTGLLEQSGLLLGRP